MIVDSEGEEFVFVFWNVAKQHPGAVFKPNPAWQNMPAIVYNEKNKLSSTGDLGQDTGL